MKKIDSIWLYLEPYTFISEDSEFYFLYNAREGNGKSYIKEKMVVSIVNELKEVDNLYSTKINIEQLVDEYLFDFINMVQLSGFGDIIEGSLDKPVIFPPVLSLQRSVERLKEHKASISENVLIYLHEIVIYLNGSCLYNCKNCLKGFKQQISCTKSEKILDFESLTKFLFSISYTGASVTLVGGKHSANPVL